MMTTITHTDPAQPTESSTPKVGEFIGAPFRSETWKAVAFDLAALPVGIVGFSIIAIGLALGLGLGLAVTLLGIPVLIATLWLAGTGARLERWRASWIGLDITAPERPVTAWTTWSGVRSRVLNGSGWKQVLHFVLLLPVGVITFTVAVTTWSYAVAALTMPFWNWSVGDGSTHVLGYSVQRPLDYAPVVAAGIVAFFLAPWICRLLARAQGALANVLLS